VHDNRKSYTFSLITENVANQKFDRILDNLTYQHIVHTVTSSCLITNTSIPAGTLELEKLNFSIG
jgi:hypothetical protein